MVASYAGGYAPEEEPRISVSGDGSLAAVQEASRITLVELPSGTAFAEIGADPEALASEVAWLGAPPRLVVLSRYEAHSTVHLLDPSGPRSISELRLEPPVHLAATVAGAALVVGQAGAAVLVATETHVMPYQFATRALPVAAGGGAANQFVVAFAGSIEEWDPQSRMPKRRLRLPRAAAITAVGGSDRVVWMTTQQEPARIDVIPLVNRGQPKAHDMPEPIARIAGHPRSDLVACVGADSGRLYIVDLDGRTKMRIVELDDIDRVETCALIVGRMIGVIAAQAGRPIAIASLDRRDHSDPTLAVPGMLPRMSPASELLPEPDDDEVPGPPEPSEPDEADEAEAAEADAEPELAPRFAPPPAAPPPAAPPPAPRAPAAPVSPLSRFGGLPTGSSAAPPPPPAPGSSPALPIPVAAPARTPASTAAAARPTSASERFSAWREQVRQHQRPEPITATPPPAGSLPAAHTDPRQTWRDEVVTWTRGVIAGALEHNPPPAPPIEALIARFELALHLQPALTLLYGAHLSGERGAAPVDVSRVLDRQWTEALGRGELAAHGIATFVGSRVALAPIIQRVLDELPPLTGTLVGEPGTSALLGPCIVIAGAAEPLTSIAERCLSRVGGAVLAAHGDLDGTDLVFEARAYGAAPLVRPSQPPDTTPTEAAIFVLDDADLADRLALPRLA